MRDKTLLGMMEDDDKQIAVKYRTQCLRDRKKEMLGLKESVVHH